MQQMFHFLCYMFLLTVDERLPGQETYKGNSFFLVLKLTNHFSLLSFYSQVSEHAVFCWHQFQFLIESCIIANMEKQHCDTVLFMYSVLALVSVLSRCLRILQDKESVYRAMASSVIMFNVTSYSTYMETKSLCLVLCGHLFYGAAGLLPSYKMKSL